MSSVMSFGKKDWACDGEVLVVPEAILASGFSVIGRSCHRFGVGLATYDGDLGVPS